MACKVDHDSPEIFWESYQNFHTNAPEPVGLARKAKSLELGSQQLSEVLGNLSQRFPCKSDRCVGDQLELSDELLSLSDELGHYGGDAVEFVDSVGNSAKKIGATTADVMQDFTRWLKKPFAGTHPERGAIGNSVDKTLEIIKGLRPEKAALDGAVLFKDVPRALRSNTWDIMENLPQALKGNQAAKDFIAKLRPHELTANFKGWTSLDLVPNNPSASPLRFLYKKEADGSIKWMIKDTH